MYKSALDNLGQDTPQVSNSENSAVSLYEENMKNYLELVASKGYTLEELEPIIRSKGKTALYATAGAGKTTALSLIFAKDKLFGDLSPEKRGKKVAWVTTFLKSGAEELQLNIERTLAKLGLSHISTNDIMFSTLHSEFLNLLKLRGYNFTDKTKMEYYRFLDSRDDAEVSRIYNTITGRLFRKHDLGEEGSNYIPQQDRKALLEIISNYRNCTLSEYTFGEAEDTAKRLNLPLNLLPDVVEDFQELKKTYYIMDFDDLMTEVKRLMVSETEEDSAVKKQWLRYFRNRYEYLMLDEAQDMSELQYEVLRPVFESCPRVILVGDPDQSIYGFRGSNPKLMSWFEEEFKPETYPLSVSYRCPSNILDPIAKSIDKNSHRYKHSLRSYKEGGELSAYRFERMQDMAEACLELIDQALLEGKSVVVQSRVNFSYSPASILYAIKRQGDFNLLGDVRDLNTARYRKVWNLIEMVRGRGLVDIKDNLKVLAPDLKPWDAKRLAERLMNLVPENENILYSQNYGYIDFIAQEYGLKSLATLVDKLRSLGAGIPSEMTLFKELLNHVQYWGEPANAEVVGTIATLAEEVSTVSDFFMSMDFVNNKIAGAKRGGTSLVTFATPFGFKGREADVNIIFDDSDGVFPYVLSTDMSFEEERRIHFVAGTRGRERTIYLTRSSKMSPFLKEMQVPIKGWTPLDGLALNSVKLKKDLSLKERMEKQKAEEALGAASDFSFDLW